MPATCVPQYVPRANTGLSKHGDPVFPHFWSWNQNLARVCARGGGGGVRRNWSRSISSEKKENEFGAISHSIRSPANSIGSYGPMPPSRSAPHCLAMQLAPLFQSVPSLSTGSISSLVYIAEQQQMTYRTGHRRLTPEHIHCAGPSFVLYALLFDPGFRPGACLGPGVPEPKEEL